MAWKAVEMTFGLSFRMRRSPVAPVMRKRDFRGTGAGPETAPAIVVRPTRGSRWTKIRRTERTGPPAAALARGMVALAVAAVAFLGVLVATGVVRFG